MSLSTSIIHSFERSFGLYLDLLEAIDESVLDRKLPGLPSNTVGLQLWCVVGARESYGKAIRAKEWSGFSCSLEVTNDMNALADALQRSERTVMAVLDSIDEYDDAQNQLLLKLLEHEAAHHGQLIRYIYALELPIPDSWREKYAL